MKEGDNIEVQSGQRFDTDILLLKSSTSRFFSLFSGLRHISNILILNYFIQ